MRSLARYLAPVLRYQHSEAALRNCARTHATAALIEKDSIYRSRRKTV